MYLFHLNRSNCITAVAFCYLLILSCCSINKEEVLACNEECFPTIVIDSKQDSLKVGEVFKAKVSLSDTSLLYMSDFNSTKKRRIHPVFKINGEIIQDHYADSFEVEEVVDSTIFYEGYPNYREISCSIIIPHPRAEEGTLELQKLITYIVVE